MIIVLLGKKMPENKTKNPLTYFRHFMIWLLILPKHLLLQPNPRRRRRQTGLRGFL